MARIVLTKGGTVLTEVSLNKERILIGRRPQCDLRINDLAVSGEHAMIVTRDNDSYLEDLNSTNGTQVNGQPVRTHFLQHQDVIELAQYRMTYLATAVPSSPDRLPVEGGPVHAKLARIRILSGPNAGREVALTKAFITFGRPGVEVAVILRRSDGYYVSSPDGGVKPTVNGEVLAGQERQLLDGDTIALSDVQLGFFRT